MVEKLHEGHLGINKTIARACEVLFWPGMTVDLTEKIKKCPVCLENGPSQKKNRKPDATDRILYKAQFGFYPTRSPL